jgi:hypothetical protein
VPGLLKIKEGFTDVAFVPFVKFQDEAVPQLVAA